MATTTTPEGLVLQKWRRDFLREFVRDSGFSPYMGNAATNIIMTLQELRSNGKTITVPLVGRLKGQGVSGNTRLSGAEEQLGQYNHDIDIEWFRNAVELTKRERHFNAADQLGVVTPLLREWATELLKYDIIEAFHTIDGVDYNDATEGQKDTWLANNSDRVLFGASVGNNSSDDHSAALGNVDNTDDKLSASMGTLAKRLARTAGPRIRPYRTGTQGREYFVMFCHPRCFRDLKVDNTMLNANREARPRDVEQNPIFQDGDLIYDGIIFREIPEFEKDQQDNTNTDTTLEGVGGSSIDVGANFLCGAQALGLAWGQMPMPTRKKDDDYGFITGRGVEQAYGIEKLQRNVSASNLIDHGVVTVYAAAEPDS